MDTPPPQFVQYPRPGSPGGPGTPSPFWRPPGVYFEAIGDAWKLVSQDLGTWVVCALIYLALSYGVNFGIQFALLGGPAMFRSGTADVGATMVAAVLQIIVSFLISVLQPGMMWMAVKKARGEAIQIGDMFSGFRRFGSVLGTNFLFGLAVVIGFLLCIVPGIWVVGAFTLAPLIALDQQVDPIEAMTRSYRTLKSDAWVMFLLLFVAGLIASVGVCLCVVGALFTMPIYLAVVGLHYYYYFPQGDSPVQVGTATPDVG